LLKERLQGLRKDRKLTLDDVFKGTGIPKSTLQRLEVDHPNINAHDTRVGYQDIVALAKFYDVSADYLCGLTENLRYSNAAIDKLHLSDEAVAELKNGRLNTRLLSEIITHPDFADLLAALEVFVDRKISENMSIVNASYKMAIDTINRQNVTVGRDEYIATLNESVIDPDDYLRFRLTQRFEKIAQGLYEVHAKEAQAETGGGYLKTLHEQIQKFQTVKDETGSVEQAKLALLADQIGVDLKKAPDEEKRSLLNLIKRSKFAQFIKKRK
jgi:transcriptional regulator with XRE-family HTH domain